MDNNQKIAIHNFAARDEKGRLIGARVETYDTNKLSADGTTSIPLWCFRPWAMRGGKVFGAIRRTREFASVVERDEAVEKYLDGARKRAEKLARAKYGDAAPAGRLIMATEPNIFVPEKAVWEQAKSLARCKCNEPSKLECTNFDLPSTTIDGNEACTCRCHKRPEKRA